MSMIDQVLKETPDTKACRLGPGVMAQTAAMFRELFPEAKRALVFDDVNTKRVAGDRVIARLKDAGIDVAEYTINPDGSWFHATYDKVVEVREKLKQVGAPYEPEMIGVSRAKFRETYRGIPYMRARYFSLDLVSRLGLMDALIDHLFGKGGVWDVAHGV